MSVRFCTECGTPVDPDGRCARCAAAAAASAPGVPAYAAATRPEYGAAAAYGSAAGSGGAAPGFGRSAAGFGGPIAGTPKLTRFSGQWNWGAWGLCPIWLMNHGGVALGIGYIVLSFIPFLNVATFGMGIYFGIKGNDWAVTHRAFADERQFVAVQNAWRNWAFGILAVSIVAAVAAAVVFAVLRGASHAISG